MAFLLPPENSARRPPTWKPVHDRGSEAQEIYEQLLGSGRLSLIEESGGRLLANWSTPDGLRTFYVGSPEFTEAVGAFVAERGLSPVSAEVISELEERLALENPLPVPSTHPEDRDRWKEDLGETQPAPIGQPRDGQSAGDSGAPDSGAPSKAEPEWSERNLPRSQEPEDDRLERVLRGLARGGAWIGKPSSLALAIGEDPFAVAEALTRNNATLAGRGIRVMTRPLGSGWVWVVVDEGLGFRTDPRDAPQPSTEPAL